MNGRELVAWNIRRLRVLQGISQDLLAADAAIDRAYLGGLEHRRENPTVDLLDRLARALSVSVSELFRIPAPDEKPPEALRGGRRRQ